jgi:uncharacterized protein YjbJ (UPF0337 family)
VSWIQGSHISFNALNQRKIMLNKNQVHGVAKDIVGQVQEEAGKLVGNKDQETKGVQKQVSGKAEKRLGDAREIVKDARAAVKDAVAGH